MSSRYPPTASSSASSSSSSSRPGQQNYPWRPPTKLLLRPTYPASNPDDFQLTMPGIDPLSFFLTPPTPNTAPYPQDDDTTMLEFDYFDYDAGIIDSKHPSSNDSVRSVSPSSLNGFSRPDLPRPPTPPKPLVSSPEASTPELEYDWGSPMEHDGKGRNEMEEYYRQRLMMAGGGGFPLLLKDFTAKDKQRGGAKKMEKERHYGHQHVWREPSPDVWSIEEEREQEEQQQQQQQQYRHQQEEEAMVARKGRGKGRNKAKRVRFVLPGEEGVF